MSSKQPKITVFFFFLIAVVFLIFAREMVRSRKMLSIPLVPKASTGEYLESYYKDPDYYNDSFSKCSNVDSSQALALITSHHFLARDIIAESFLSIDPTNIETVVIVGPDHFQQIHGQNIMIQTTNANWHTPFGGLQANSDLIEKITQLPGVYSDINLFRTEHSIYTLIPFVKKVMPNVTIVPLVLKQSSDIDLYYEFGSKLSKLTDPDKTLLVISSDFSHSTTVQKAEKNDLLSIKLLPDKNINDVKKITNDCVQCTTLLFGYLKSVDTKFGLLFNENSYDISGKDPGNVTSYVGAIYSKD